EAFVFCGGIIVRLATRVPTLPTTADSPLIIDPLAFSTVLDPLSSLRQRLWDRIQWAESKGTNTPQLSSGLHLLSWTHFNLIRSQRYRRPHLTMLRTTCITASYRCRISPLFSLIMQAW